MPGVEFPTIETTLAAIDLPEIPAIPATHCGHVRLDPNQKCWFVPKWSGANLVGVEGEWFFEVGSWGEDGQTWVSAGVPSINHHEANLLDPAVAAANPEVTAMAQAFAAMVALSQRKGLI